MIKKQLLIVTLLVLSLSVMAKRYVVMVSLDGFRWDYCQWYDTPFLDRMAAEGVESGLIPSFPSKTFPNHYTIATGLTPDHHGIIGNSFLERSTGVAFKQSSTDPHFWGGEPLWVTAKKQGIKNAIFYWPGSEMKIQGMYPDLYHIYNDPARLSLEQRVHGMLDQLRKPESERPQLIMSYMNEPDKSGHDYGPQSKHTRAAVEKVDSLLNVLYDGIQALPYASEVDFIVLSDHGMALVTPEQQIRVSDYLKSEWIRAIKGDMPANIYANEQYPGAIDSIYNAIKDVPHLRVWKKTETNELGYGSNINCGDVIASPDMGWIFCDDSVYVGGMHGYDPAFLDMQAVFRAVGPDFKHVKRPHFRNVNVYPLVCRLLGMKPAENDGNIDEIMDILK